MGTSHGHSRDTGVWYHLQDLVLSLYGTNLVSAASYGNYHGETISFSPLGQEAGGSYGIGRFFSSEKK